MLYDAHLLQISQLSLHTALRHCRHCRQALGGNGCLFFYARKYFSLFISKFHYRQHVCFITANMIGDNVIYILIKPFNISVNSNLHTTEFTGKLRIFKMCGT